MKPTTDRNSSVMGIATFSDCHFSPQLCTLAGGAQAGLIHTSTTMVRMMVIATTTLGMIAPMNSLPMLTSATSPYSTSATLGGISMPRVPEIATTP
jgi:hypothetical protein